MADFLSDYFNHLADAAAWVLGRKPLTTEAALAFGIWTVCMAALSALRYAMGETRCFVRAW